MFDIIINPVAGKGKSLAALKKVEEILKSKEIAYNIYFTKYKSHATELTSKLNTESTDTKLLILGGDGTFNEVLNGIQNFDTVTLGFVPCGTGNDFIKSLHMTTDVNKNLELILNNNQKFIDFIQLDNKRALNCAGVGMDVDTLLKYEKIKFFKGKLKYYIALISTLIHLKFHKVAVTIDNKTTVADVFMVVVANGTHIGGGMPVQPMADPFDNYFDIVLVNKISPAKVLPLLLKFLKGKHINEPCTECYKATDVTLKLLPGENPKFQVDGEVFDSQELNCKLISGKLKIFC